jgi:F0F1-type ATP synthase membrane subunit c/vacuolar-type H+-ATPase subunit K
MLVLRMQLPDWSAALIVSVSVGLALLVLTAMLLPVGRRMGRRADAVAADPAPERTRPGLDVMLLVSTLGIVALALAVYPTRP